MCFGPGNLSCEPRIFRELGEVSMSFTHFVSSSSFGGYGSECYACALAGSIGVLNEL